MCVFAIHEQFVNNVKRKLVNFTFVIRYSRRFNETDASQLKIKRQITNQRIIKNKFLDLYVVIHYA